MCVIHRSPEALEYRNQFRAFVLGEAKFDVNAGSRQQLHRPRGSELDPERSDRISDIIVRQATY
jgi:hypothetical protein